MRGTVRFIPHKNGTLVVAEISCLPATDTGFFAFDIHEGGNYSGPDFPNTDSHYNPDNQNHPLHAGDRPPLLSSDGSAYLALMTDRFGIKDVIGRIVVIHRCQDRLWRHFPVFVHITWLSYWYPLPARSRWNQNSQKWRKHTIFHL